MYTNLLPTKHQYIKHIKNHKSIRKDKNFKMGKRYTQAFHKGKNINDKKTYIKMFPISIILKIKIKIIIYAISRQSDQQKLV